MPTGNPRGFPGSTGKKKLGVGCAPGIELETLCAFDSAIGFGV